MSTPTIRGQIINKKYRKENKTMNIDRVEKKLKEISFKNKNKNNIYKRKKENLWLTSLIDEAYTQLSL